MRLTIVRDDNLIIKDGVGYYADLSVFDDLSWIPDYDAKSWGKFHALQWYGYADEYGEYGFGLEEPHGEIEFKKPVPNLIVKELGIYEQALPLWEAAKLAEEERIAAEEAERQRLKEEEEARIRDAYLELDNQLDLDMQELLSDDVDEDLVALQLEEDLEKLLADL
jgi:hypothetical protein